MVTQEGSSNALRAQASWGSVPGEGDRCLPELRGLSALPRALCSPGRHWNWNCKHLLPIYFYLAMSSRCLQEHPNHAFGLLKDRTWRVPAGSLSPSRAINGRGSRATTAGRPEKSARHKKGASWLSLRASSEAGKHN